MENRVEKYFPDDGKKPQKSVPKVRSEVDVAAYPLDNAGLVVFVVHRGEERFEVYLSAETAEKAWSRIHEAWATLTGFYEGEDEDDDE